MENNNNILRIKFLSFKDSKKHNLNSTLCYVKKLIQLPPNSDNTLILEPSKFAPTDVISISESFNWNINEGNYCQMLFLTSKSKPKARADLILWFDHLLDLVKDHRNTRENQSELTCSMILHRDYHLEFSVQQIDQSASSLSPTTPTSHLTSLRRSGRHHKVPSRQSMQGHIMKLTQFNHPVHCAICHGFIWGLHRQGFECTQCNLVTHKKCCQIIPFWCRKSLNPEPISQNESGRLKFHITHSFKQYEAPLVQALITRNHSHCNHCGSQIIRNALKCTQCYFIIHEHCQMNIPPMCTISYDKIGEIITGDDLFNMLAINHRSKAEYIVDRHSKSSSFDLSWLDSLPDSDLIQNGRMSFPSFEDFEYIGRLGNGAFAQVYCVEHIQSKKYVAIKVADGKNNEARQQLEIEKQILFRYSKQNPYMIKAYCTFHRGTKLFLVMELVEGGTLYHKIQTTRMNEDEIRFYLAEIICILQYLHSNQIVYRDLKLEHAVVCSDGHIRLVDYGLGRILKNSDETCHTFCGTYSYMAPEVRALEYGAAENGYNYSVDFWALGIVFVQLLCGEQFDIHSQISSNSNEEMSETLNIAEYLELPRHTSPEARSCVLALLETDPEKRLGSPNSPHGLIRDHPFFKVGGKLVWQDIDQGLSKPSHRNSTVRPILSDTSVRQPLSTLILDRGHHGKSDWISAGQSTCSSSEDEEQIKSFDYVDQSAWLELIQSDFL